MTQHINKKKEVIDRAAKLLAPIFEALIEKSHADLNQETLILKITN